jgi:excisionase family DNA binding protein
MTTKALLTVNEAAAALGKRPETVRRWLAAGVIESSRAGGRVLIPAAALPALARRICACCGQSYQPDRPTRAGLYCSKACAWRAAYARRKAAMPDPAPVPIKKLDISNPRLAAALKATRKP